MQADMYMDGQESSCSSIFNLTLEHIPIDFHSTPLLNSTDGTDCRCLPNRCESRWYIRRDSGGLVKRDENIYTVYSTPLLCTRAQSLQTFPHSLYHPGFLSRDTSFFKFYQLFNGHILCPNSLNHIFIHKYGYFIVNYRIPRYFRLIYICIF